MFFVEIQKKTCFKDCQTKLKDFRFSEFYDCTEHMEEVLLCNTLVPIKTTRDHYYQCMKQQSVQQKVTLIDFNHTVLATEVIRTKTLSLVNQVLSLDLETIEHHIFSLNTFLVFKTSKYYFKDIK